MLTAMAAAPAQARTDDAHRELRRRLRERVRIEDVLAKFQIATRGRGRAFCPFHLDRRRPSLTWHAIDTPDEGAVEVWRCWACRAHGDLFTLVQLLGGYATRGDAIRALAAEQRLPVPDRRPRDSLLRDRVLELAADYYARHLAGPALAYLASRGLPEPLLAEHRVGYAPPTPLTGFAQHCEAHKLDRIAEAVGLVQPATDRTPRRDYFRGRIIFPNLVRGRAVDLQGRAWPNREPRYLTLPSHANGDEELYGHPRVYNAEAASRAHVVVCEGIPDTLSVLAGGLPACGIYGTQGWRDGYRALFRSASRVYVAMDRDAQDAAIAIASAFGTRGRVLVPPEALGEHGDLNDWLVTLAGRDPARFAAMLRDAMAAAPTPWELWISRLPEVRPSERHDQIQPLLRDLAGLPRLFQHAHLELLHRRTGLPAAALAGALDEIEEELSAPPGDAP